MMTFQTPLVFSRRPVRVVSVGNLKIGGAESICLQSMLTANSWDIPNVLAEIKALAQANCELIRITVPNQRAVESLPLIRAGMKAQGIAIPLVADIHFNPQLAIDSCEFVEKVRINPGNYADRKRFEIREYSDAQYQEELERIEVKLLPLIANLKKYHCALRIGTNHGSLSDRILNRYGDTPEGMVESALEFIRIFQKHQYQEIIISMKSSNPLVMMQAYRCLVVQMEQEGMAYPLHLGVTEAGSGLEGRIKSAIGIGSLLYDGIGDTIRVSLTEPAEHEIPVAQAILAGLQTFQKETWQWAETHFEAPIQFVKRRTQPVPLTSSQTENAQPVQVGGEEPFRFLAVSAYAIKNLASSAFDQILNLPALEDSFSKDMQRFDTVLATSQNRRIPPVLLIEAQDLESAVFSETLAILQQHNSPKLILFRGAHPLFPVRFMVQKMQTRQMNWPLGILVPEIDEAEQWYGLAAQIGSLIADDLIECLVCPTTNLQKPIYLFCQTLLQGTRARMFKADFISCPSCGRTFFDLTTTTEAIKAQTQHLKGVKIGIMGCIVNGPGEMADADFGYVGAGEGKINLYRKQECVAHNIPEEQAVEHLIALIKAHGAWSDP